MSNDGPSAVRAVLWSPVLVSIAAGLLFLTGAIGDGTVVLLCSVSWLAWWIAAIIVLIRTGFTNSPQVKHVARLLIAGGLVTYGVIWATSLI